jgi:DNA-binding NarL/FixJ family response regulator
MEKKYKIVIVDDHDILRDGLKFTLTQIEFADVVGEARNGKEFLQLMETTVPDVILMDIAMPEMDGIEATKEILKKLPDLKIIALTMFGDEEYYFKMVHAGARGFVLKKSGINELEKAIIAVADGENYFSNELLRNIIVNITDNKIRKAISDTPVNLTKKQLEVLQQICNGLTKKEIAEKLHISPKTVEGHRNNLLAKTGSKNTVSMVMYAIKNKLIEF